MKRFTLLIVLVTVAIVVGVSTAGCTSNVLNNASPSPSASPQPTQDPNFVAKNTPGYVTYSNRSAGFTIQYPSSWRVTDSNASTGFNLFINTGTASGTVAGVTVTKPIKIPESVTNITLSNFSEMLQPKWMTNYKLLNSSKSTLSGYPSQRDVFTYVSPRGDPSQGIFEATLTNRTGYSVMYIAMQSYYSAETAQNMMQSFNIVS